MSLVNFVPEVRAYPYICKERGVSKAILHMHLLPMARDRGHCKNKCLFVAFIFTHLYLSIYEIYIAPLQGNYSEALPGPGEIKVLRSL